MESPSATWNSKNITFNNLSIEINLQLAGAVQNHNQLQRMTSHSCLPFSCKNESSSSEPKRTRKNNLEFMEL